jgi:hypothetical protein
MFKDQVPIDPFVYLGDDNDNGKNHCRFDSNDVLGY